MQLIRRDPDKGYLDTMLWVPKGKVNVDGAKAALTFHFFDERNERILILWRETTSHLLVPRELWDPATCDFPVIDCLPGLYQTVDIRSSITLDFKAPEKTTQKDALAAVLAKRGGILQLACGVGKTVIALEAMARLKVPTLIIVDNTQLLDQWEVAIAKFLTVPGGIGRIQADVFDWKKAVVLATYTTLANQAATMPEEVRRWFGFIVWDEAHHMGAPTWAKSADLFYGKRLALTATPDRTDGYHVIYDFHVGKVIYKDLTQDLKPDFYFLWTGLSLDLEDAAIRKRVLDVTGEVHISKIATYFSTWRVRLTRLIREVENAVAQGRRILVISKSVDEIVNLLALWNGKTDLYTDVPWPTIADLGETLEPAELSKKMLDKLKETLLQIEDKLKASALHPTRRGTLEKQKEGLTLRLRQHVIFTELVALHTQRKNTYLKELLAMPSTAGIMIHKVSPKDRTAMLRSKQVMFVIAKYGREGLDEDRLDTIIASFPVSDRNVLQQLMGRIQRRLAGKKRCIVCFLEDDIQIVKSMCSSIRRHLREWPREDGGPFTYTNLGHPAMKERIWKNERLRTKA